MSTVTASDVIGGNLAQEFEELFREHYRLVYRTAYSITGHPEDAEDVLQTLFLRLLRREVLPDLKKNPKAYFYRAAVNLSLSAVQLKNRHILTAEAEGFAAPSSAAGMDQREERRQRLLDALAQLKPKAVEILILRYGHDYSDAAIAKMLGTSRGVIAVTLYRSRARLKKLMRAAARKKS